MSEWRDTNLGEVLEIKYGKDHKHLATGKIPAYGSGGVMRYVDAALYDDESILIPRKGSLNNVIYESKPFWTVDTMFWSKIDKTLAYPKFLFYQLTEIDYMNLNVGSAVPSLTVPVINAIEISLPPLEVQKAIASVLSSLDDKIDLLHRQNTTLERMAETLFRQWFVEEVQDSNIGQFIDLQYGYAFKSQDFKDIGEHRVLKIKNISGGIIDVNNTDFLDTSVTNKTDAKFKVVTGDILFAMTGAEIGKLGIVPKTVTPFWLNQRVGLLKEKYRGARFLAYLQLNSEIGQDYIENSATGSAQPNISGSLIEQCPFPKIEASRIKECGEILDVYYQKLISNLGQIQTLEKLRDNLLPKLMSGVVKVNYLSKELK